MTRITATIEKVQFGKDGKNVARFIYRTEEGEEARLTLEGDAVQWFRDHGFVRPGVWDGIKAWLKPQSNNSWVWDGWHEDTVDMFRERVCA